MRLESDIAELVAAGGSADRPRSRAVFARLRQALSAGEARAAAPDDSRPTGWRVNAWVKQGILLGFRFGDLIDVSTHDQPLVIPENAVVVPGARNVTVGKGPEWGLSLATPAIVKYRDSQTDTRTELEAWIR